MGTIGLVLLVFFVIVCLLLVLLVSIQDDGENGMGLLGGRGTAAFGSHSASVLTKTTCVLVVLFFVLAFGLAFVNKKPKIDSSIVEKVTETTVTDGTASSEDAASASANWWDSTEETAETSESTEDAE